MQSSEKLLPSPIITARNQIDSVLLLTAAEASSQYTALLTQLIASYGLGWVTRLPGTSFPKSRRNVSIVRPKDTIPMVVKQKVRANRSKKDSEKLRVSFFTQSIVHELRTTYLLQILLNQIDLPDSLAANNKIYNLDIHVQKPIAAMIDLKDPSLRYTIFEYMIGESVREEVREYGGWTYTSETQRRLFTAMQGVLSEIAQGLVENGLEPWDLGVHQVVYDIQGPSENLVLQLGLLDTEEYNIADRYGSCWDTGQEVTLPPVLPFL